MAGPHSAVPPASRLVIVDGATPPLSTERSADACSKRGGLFASWAALRRRAEQHSIRAAATDGARGGAPSQLIWGGGVRAWEGNP
jgi:hypothetical protein